MIILENFKNPMSRSNISSAVAGVNMLASSSDEQHIKYIKEGGFNSEGIVEICPWEDDTDDATGWHDPPFKGFRVVIFQVPRTPEYEIKNLYGKITYAEVGYILPENYKIICEELSRLGDYKIFISFLKEYFEEEPNK